MLPRAVNFGDNPGLFRPIGPYHRSVILCDNRDLDANFDSDLGRRLPRHVLETAEAPLITYFANRHEWRLIIDFSALSPATLNSGPIAITLPQISC